MKSNTMLSEEQRKRLQILIDENLIKTVYKDCYNALLAAEEEIELKEGSNQMLSAKMNHQREELEFKNSIIERLHNEKQALIEENAILKADWQNKLKGKKMNDLSK